MATQAEDIVARGSVPDVWTDRAAEVSATIKDGFAELVALGDNALVPATRFERDADGNVLTDANGVPNVVMLTDEAGNPVMEDHPLAHIAEHHGLHAYSYEPCSDGSIVAIWSNDTEGTIQLKAFANIEEASLWSPRDERE